MYIYLSSEIWFGDSSYCWPAPSNFQGSLLLNRKWHLLTYAYDTDGESDLCLSFECIFMLGDGFETLGN